MNNNITNLQVREVCLEWQAMPWKGIASSLQQRCHLWSFRPGRCRFHGLVELTAPTTKRNREGATKGEAGEDGFHHSRVANSKRPWLLPRLMGVALLTDPGKIVHVTYIFIYTQIENHIVHYIQFQYIIYGVTLVGNMFSCRLWDPKVGSRKVVTGSIDCLAIYRIHIVFALCFWLTCLIHLDVFNFRLCVKIVDLLLSSDVWFIWLFNFCSFVCLHLIHFSGHVILHMNH